MAGKRSGYNHCRVEVYNQYSNTPVPDPDRDLQRAKIEGFETVYPNGLCGQAQIIVPRNYKRGWLYKQSQTLRIRNRSTLAYEGQIVSPGYVTGDIEGRSLTVRGPWDELLSYCGLNKPWCDTRETDDAWPQGDLTATGHSAFHIDRNNRLRLVTKGITYFNGDKISLEYTAPTGQTIKRFACTTDLQEGGQDWTLKLYDPVGAADIWTTSATGTGSQDVTLGTPRQVVRLQLVSNATQSPDGKGTIYGEISGVKVYTETGLINPTEIVKDWRAAISSLNSDENKIESNTLTMEPWLTAGYEMAARNLARLAEFGDSSFLPWAVSLLPSEEAASPDGKPVMKFAPRPLLSDYDYVLRLNDSNVSGDVRLIETPILNWIVVEYQDGLGQTRIVTPDDDANLTNGASSAEWGRREHVFPVRFASQSSAVAAGRRLLSRHKDKHYYLSGSLAVEGFIKAKQGNVVPSSLIQAGKRVRVANFLTDETGTAGAGVTDIITHTRYTDADEKCHISFGIPDDMAVLIARLTAFPETALV